MTPFSISNEMTGITDPYANPDVVINAAKKGGQSAKDALARLWLSEGIPFAFRDCPAIYESMRTWLSIRIGVHAKEISVAGSARIGASLAPKKLGQPFSHSSDLDLFVISKSLFDALQRDFLKWSDDFDSGKVSPKTRVEERYWKANVTRTTKNIDRGFIDNSTIPTRQRYPEAQKVSQVMYLLVMKMEVTTNAPSPPKASIRVYQDWDSFVRQMRLNLS